MYFKAFSFKRDILILKWSQWSQLTLYWIQISFSHIEKYIQPTTTMILISQSHVTNSLIINRKAQNLRTNVRLNTSLTVTLRILQVEIIHNLTRRRRKKEGNTTTMGMAISLVQMAEERVPKKYPHLGCTTEKGSGECFLPTSQQTLTAQEVNQTR